MEVIKNECISKLEAVRILQKAYTEGRIQAKDGLVSVLDDINAADVQPVKCGKWDNEYLDDDIWWAECTACKDETHSRYGRVSAYNYCPNCGADMRGNVE